MWNKKAVPAVEPSPAERLRIAGDQVTLTTGAITRLREEYAAYQRAHDLVIRQRGAGLFLSNYRRRKTNDSQSHH